MIKSIIFNFILRRRQIYTPNHLFTRKIVRKKYANSLFTPSFTYFPHIFLFFTINFPPPSQPSVRRDSFEATPQCSEFTSCFVGILIHLPLFTIEDVALLPIIDFPLYPKKGIALSLFLSKTPLYVGHSSSLQTRPNLLSHYCLFE